MKVGVVWPGRRGQAQTLQVDLAAPDCGEANSKEASGEPLCRLESVMASVASETYDRSTMAGRRPKVSEQGGEMGAGRQRRVASVTDRSSRPLDDDDDDDDDLCQGPSSPQVYLRLDHLTSRSACNRSNRPL